MRAKLFLIPVLLIPLAACSNSAAYHVGEAERHAMEVPPTPVKQFVDAGFCHNVATNGIAYFDASTQERISNVTFAQCMVVFGPPDLRLADLNIHNDRY
jgi:hypothetical protein